MRIGPVVKFILVFGLLAPLVATLPFYAFGLVDHLLSLGDSDIARKRPVYDAALDLAIVLPFFACIFGAIPSIVSGGILVKKHQKKVLFGYWTVVSIVVVTSLLMFALLCVFFSWDSYSPTSHGLSRKKILNVIYFYFFTAFIFVIPAVFSASVLWALRHKLGYGYLGQAKPALQQVSNDGNAVNE